MNTNATPAHANCDECDRCAARALETLRICGLTEVRADNYNGHFAHVTDLACQPLRLF